MLLVNRCETEAAARRAYTGYVVWWILIMSHSSFAGVCQRVSRQRQLLDMLYGDWELKEWHPCV